MADNSKILMNLLRAASVRRKEETESTVYDGRINAILEVCFLRAREYLWMVNHNCIP